MEQNALIQVTQLPIIEEHLQTLKNHWDQLAADAESRICTEDTIQAVKGFRADMRKEFDEVEAQRKAAKKAFMEPWEQLEAVYKDCVTTAFQRADRACAEKISDVESDMKRRCEDGLREYFAELCSVNHVEWLAFEQTGVKVDLTSAKAKTPKKLREQLTSFVADTVKDIDAIAGMEDADEILAEYKQRLNFADAINTVQERHKRIEQEREAKAAYEVAKAQEAEAVKKIEALVPPARLEPPIAAKPEKNPNDIIPKCTFTAYDSPRWVLQQVKDVFERNGIRYE